jgi:hypothetical protein
VIFGVFRAPGGTIAEENRFRSPVSGSVRLSFTRGTVIRSAFRRSALPPVNRGALAQQVGCPLDVCHVAELPQLLGATRVLEQNAIDIECVKAAAAKIIDRGSYVRDELAERRLVVGRYHLAGFPAL